MYVTPSEWREIVNLSKYTNENLNYLSNQMYREIMENAVGIPSPYVNINRAMRLMGLIDYARKRKASLRRRGIRTIALMSAYAPNGPMARRAKANWNKKK